MNGDFFDLLTEGIRREAAGGRVTLDPALWQALNRAAAPPQPAPQPIPEPPRAAVTAPPVRASESAADSPEAALEAVAAQVAACRNCRLCERRHTPVPGEGNPRARLMFIGEGPGEEEDRTGRPFVGRAGQLLDKMIAAMTLRREEVFIANVVKCRPPGNRAPEPDEAAACIGYLKRQIRAIRPEVIVTLGGVALSFLLREPQSITRMRGHWTEFEGIAVMPTFHPAYLLRQESAKREAWSDLQQVMKALGLSRPPRR